MAVASSRAPSKQARGPRGDGLLAAIFIAPAMAGFLVFLLWPTLRGIYLSFTRYNLLTPAEWVGLDNYRRMVNDPIFWGSLRVTVEYVVINIGVQTVAALCIAVLMQRLTTSSLLRGVVLTPYLVSNVVAGVVFLWILDTQLGIGNEILGALGFDHVAFLASNEWVIPSVALINVWRHVGYTALLLFAGLQAIPGDVYEAARVDGAGKVRIFFQLSLPMASAPLITLGVLTYITAWNDYFWPLMVSYSDSSRVLTVALSIFRSQTPQSGTDWAGLMAATLIAALPMLVLFGVFARRIVNSIGFSGLK
ncbi:ABC transporter permease subunit [Streptomyces scopuliridis]|uniref:ABC transporter permease subunit n=1 Tax=Streptomyces scopuliridis TaxID=452529 RepID=UPI0036CCE86A